ncbi:MAG: PAS domain S-box protein, partial [Promethearchaeota archaeon]
IELLTAPNGVQTWFEINRIPLHDTEGKVEGILVTYEDITKRKTSEQKLQESEENYRNLVVNLSDIILEVEENGNVVYVSPQSYNIMGYQPEELIGRSAFKFIHPEDGSKIAEIMRKGVQSGEMVLISHYKLLHKNGEIIEASARGKYVNVGGNKRFIGAIRDITAQKKIEEKLRESEENYHTIFNASPDYIYITDIQGNLIDANQSLLKRIGITLEELKKTNFTQYYAGDDIEGLMEIFKDLTLGKEIKDIEITAKNVKGEIFEYEVNAVPLKKDGVVIKILNLARDITEKKIVEQRLQRSQEELKLLNKELEQKIKERTKDLIESERQYRTTINSLGDPLHVVNKDLKIILANQAIMKWLTELKLESGIVGKNLFSVFPFLPPVIREEYKQVFETGIPLMTTESTILPKLNAITETRKIPIFSGGVVEQVITIIRDVTERREMENQLKESEEKYRSMVNDLDIAFYRGEYKGGLLMHNQSMARILELDPDRSILGKESAEFFADPILHKKYHKELEEKGYIRNFIAQIRKMNGEIITIDLNAHLIYNSEGLPIEVEGTIADITEKFRLQQELLESEKKLREQNLELMKLDQVKNDFITMAAHELKTPLISISGYTDYILMRHRSGLAPEITADLVTVQRNVKRLEVLMDQLLDVMKIDEQKLMLQ